MDTRKEASDRMPCKICGRSDCASWMHRLEEREEHEELAQMDDAELRRMIGDLRREVEDLRAALAKARAVREGTP